MTFLPRFACVLVGLLATPLVRAESLIAPQRVSLEAGTDFRRAANWHVGGGLAGDPRRDKALTPAPGTGVLINIPTPQAKEQLVSTWTHGDIELDLDFLMASGSNSGVYLQGRYEVQLFDSWGVKQPKDGDCGGIYQRWDASRGASKEGYDGVAPRANACRAPGLWQHLHVEFEAPRFDASGKKTKNARFRKVVLNGFVIHENVEVSGPTRSSIAADEQPLGPLMIQGDHGSVALRAISYKRFDAQTAIRVEKLSYQLYSGAFKSLSELETEKPTSQGDLTKFTESAVEKSGRFALTFMGTLVVPKDGEYAFSADTFGNARLVIDDEVVVRPLDRGAEPATKVLKAGPHRFRLDHLHNYGGRPFLDLIVEGPGIAPLSVMANEPPAVDRERPKPVFIEPTEGRVRMQRGFVPFEPKKRLYAISVGTPAGVHYAYDFETSAILRVWRGAWLDTTEMWVNRGEPQLAKAAGPALTLQAKPTIAMIESPKTAGWPDQLDPLASSQGYTLEANGQPVFQSSLAGLKITDRIAPTADGSGLERTMTFKGTLAFWETFVLLAEADQITPQPGGGWVVGDRSYYIDVPKDAPLQPVLHLRGGRQQLVARISRSSLADPLVYSLIW
ncbi:MAG: family 16 glycoside hydrolase [Opitutus sp.]